MTTKMRIKIILFHMTIYGIIKVSISMMMAGCAKG